MVSQGEAGSNRLFMGSMMRPFNKLWERPCATVLLGLQLIFLNGCPSSSQSKQSIESADANMDSHLEDSGIQLKLPILKIEFGFDGGNLNLLDSGVFEFNSQIHPQFSLQISPLPIDVRLVDSSDKLVPCDESREHLNLKMNVQFTLLKSLAVQKSHYIEVTFEADSGISDQRFEFMSVGDAGTEAQKSKTNRKVRRSK
jgi:hypothetical protein